MEYLENKIIRCGGFYEWIENILVEQNRNFLFAFTGAPGVGKSWSALKLCYEMSKRLNVPFSENNVFFTIEEMVSLINSVPDYSFLILDEAVYSFDARTFMSLTNRAIREILITCRFRHLSLIFCSPSLSFIDKTGRELLTYFGFCRMEEPTEEDLRKKIRRGKLMQIWKKHELDDVLKVRFTGIELEIEPPPEFLTQNYERKARTFKLLEYDILEKKFNPNDSIEKIKNEIKNIGIENFLNEYGEIDHKKIMKDFRTSLKKAFFVKKQLEMEK
ncbi:MAG: hypothetical protein ABIL37_01260 [candidate division WOR-3 bacterium]